MDPVQNSLNDLMRVLLEKQGIPTTSREEEREKQHLALEREAEASRLQWIQNYYSREVFLPSRAASKTFENYQAQPSDASAVEIIKNWETKDDFGLYIEGSPGSGKTHLMLSIFNRILNSPEFSRQKLEACWFPVSLSLSQIRDELQASSNKTKTRALNADYLFMDDLGVENVSPWSLEVIYQIFEFRLSKSMPTFISTNLTLDEVKRIYHERLFSRIKEMCVIVRLNGKDNRGDILKSNVLELKNRVQNEM